MTSLVRAQDSDASHRELARCMFQHRYHDAHFNVSFFDLFAHGLNQNGEVSFDPDLADAVAAANAVLARWDDPTGFGAPVLPFIHSYGSFLVDQELARFGHRQWLTEEEEDRPGSFLASLDPAGKGLMSYIAELSPDLLETDDLSRRARSVLSLRKHLFRPEIELGEREAARECSAKDYGAALGWAYRVLRLDPDSAVAREVVATAREATSPLLPVDCSRWLPVVESVDGWLSTSEVVALAQCVAAAPVDRAQDIVEIGSYKGRSTLAIALAISELGLPFHLTAIDPHEGYRFGDGTETHAILSSNLSRNGVDHAVTVVRAASTDVQLDAPIAFAFVDGLHDAEPVRTDYAHISSFLVEGSLIAFHDYFEHYPGILDLVDELLATDQYEFVDCADRLIVLRRS